MFGTKENHKRDLQKRPQKRPTEETYKTDPQNRPTKDEKNRPTQEIKMFCKSLKKKGFVILF